MPAIRIFAISHWTCQCWGVVSPWQSPDSNMWLRKSHLTPVRPASPPTPAVLTFRCFPVLSPSQGLTLTRSCGRKSSLSCLLPSDLTSGPLLPSSASIRVLREVSRPFPPRLGSSVPTSHALVWLLSPTSPPVGPEGLYACESSPILYAQHFAQSLHHESQCFLLMNEHKHKWANEDRISHSQNILANDHRLIFLASAAPTPWAHCPHFPEWLGLHSLGLHSLGLVEGPWLRHHRAHAASPSAGPELAVAALSD